MADPVTQKRNRWQRDYFNALLGIPGIDLRARERGATDREHTAGIRNRVILIFHNDNRREFPPYSRITEERNAALRLLLKGDHIRTNDAARDRITMRVPWVGELSPGVNGRIMPRVSR